MEIKRALRILNLRENYTEEELKKAYRALIIKYHPDKYQGKDKEKVEMISKQINEAKDTLKNAPFTKNLFSYRKFIEQELFEMERIDPKDQLLSRYEILLKLSLYAFSHSILSCSNKTELENEFAIFIRKYQQTLMRYCFAFSTSSGISITNIKNCISIREVKQIMIATIDNILTKELSYFVYDPYFNDLLPQFLSIKEKYLKDCLYGYNNIAETKCHFDKEIILTLKNYTKRKELLEKAKLNSSISYSRKWSPTKRKI